MNLSCPHAPSRPPRAVFPLIATITALLLIGVTAAQPGARKYTLESTLRYYQRNADKPEGRRSHPVAALGDYQSPEVTEILLAEVARAQTAEFRRTAVRALGRARRAGALPVLRGVFDAAAEDFVLRNHAANGLARQGDPGAAMLVERFKALPDKLSWQQRSMRRSLLGGLALTTSEAAQRALAAAVGTGDFPDRLDALKALRAVAPSEVVTPARRAAASARDLGLAAEAVRQLAVHGAPDLEATVLSLHRKTRRSEDGAVHAAMLRALARYLTERTYAAFFEHAAFVAPEIDATLVDLAPQLAADAAFGQWLLDKGLQQSSGRAIAVAIRLLGSVEGEAVTRALLPRATARDPEVARTAVRVLGERGDPLAVPFLRKLLTSGPAAERAEAMRGLHLLLRDDAAWRAELLGHLDSKQAALRTLAIDLLGDLGAVEALAAVHGDLDAKTWPVRAAAYDFCRQVRHVDSIPLLIARLGVERGRLVEDVLDALEDLTALRFARPERWQRWWSEEGDGYQLPPPPEERGARRRRASVGDTVSYYDLPVSSNRCAFVIDTSGSMRLPYGAAGGSRIAETKRQLQGVLDRAPAGFHCNLIFFGTRVTPLYKQLTGVDGKALKKARKAVEACVAKGGTNIHDALERAFADPDLDTIYLLSDGYPSAGKIRDPDALADEVARWNRTRRVRIHAVAVGARSPLLQRLAADSGGRSVWVR